MRKATKSVLRAWVLDKFNPCPLASAPACIVDGGALLHKVTWSSGSSDTYKDVIAKYIQYVKRKYGKFRNVCVVFDGFRDTFSTKSQEHQRRGQVSSSNITITENMKVLCAAKSFLQNQQNKQQLIKLLCIQLKQCGFMTVECTGDADVTIVKTALEFAVSYDTIVSADDTDILVLLTHHWKEDSHHEIYFSTEIKEKNKKTRLLKNWSIKSLVNEIPPKLLDHILFTHAWGGCDTTAATFRHGKLKILRLISSDNEVQVQSGKYSEIGTTREKIEKSSSSIFVKLYNGKPDDSLTTLRHAHFMENIATCMSINPAVLPPTDRAAYYHSLTVHLQLAQWKKLDLTCLHPTDWGWKSKDGVLVPIKTDLEPAPESLLSYIHCNCKLSTKNTCGGQVCSCRKVGLKCVSACGDCRGEHCENRRLIVVEEQVQEDDACIFNLNI